MTALTRLLTSTPFRLTLAYMGAFVVAAAVVGGFIAWRANDLLTTKVVETLEAEVVGLREQFEAGGPERLAAVVAQRASQPGSGLYLLVDSAGRKIAGNLDHVPAELARTRAGGLFNYIRVSVPGIGVPRAAVGVPLPVPGGPLLIVGRDIEDLNRFAATMGQLGLISIALLSALSIGAGLLISRGMLRRIEAVTEASRTIMAGDLSKRIPINGSGDELDRLSANLNAMLARIEELMASLREVSDNIAHDLKTPLNRLRNRAEAALRSPDGASAYRDGLTKTIDEADDLIKTFNSLLLIARLEAGAVAETLTLVDPAAIIADVAELYEPAAEEAGFALQVSATGRCGVRANRELISQAVANLVDNAIKYSAEHARKGDSIAITLVKAGGNAEIAVGDRGPGIPSPDRERALKRFVRLEQSRSRPGSGLGLSLVAAVARLHGGTVRLEDNMPGLKVVLSLPCAETREGATIPLRAVVGRP